MQPKEMKIGLFVGLGVIILIGMLLSNYFESDGTVRPADMRALGAPYRQAVQQPVGLALDEPRGNPGGAPISIPTTGGTGELAVAYTRDGGPVVGPAATPELMGRAPDARGNDTAGPGLELADSRQPVAYTADPTKAGNGAPVKVAATLPAGDMVTIAKGDSLAGIAKRYYHASGKAEIGRIVAANPGLLQDEKTVLVIGKKLVVPLVAKPVVKAAEVVKTGVDSRTVVAPRSTSMVHLPGIGDRIAASSAMAEAKTAVDVAGPKAEDLKKLAPTYTVAPGDTLEKIAKKVLGAPSAENIKKLAKLNRMGVEDVLQVGKVLKVPAKEAAKTDAKG